MEEAQYCRTAYNQDAYHDSLHAYAVRLPGHPVGGRRSSHKLPMLPLAFLYSNGLSGSSKPLPDTNPGTRQKASSALNSHPLMPDFTNVTSHRTRTGAGFSSDLLNLEDVLSCFVWLTLAVTPEHG